MRPKAAYYAVKRQLAPEVVGLKRFTKRNYPDPLSAAKYTERHFVDVWISSFSTRKHFRLQLSAVELSTGKTVWTYETAAELRGLIWDGFRFEVPQSTTDPDSAIVVAARLYHAPSSQPIARDMAWPEPFACRSKADPS